MIRLARLLLSVFLLLGPVMTEVAFSCPVCFGDKASAEVEGAKWAILFLLGVTGTVLSGVLTFILYLRKRARATLGSINLESSHQEL